MHLNMSRRKPSKLPKGDPRIAVALLRVSTDKQEVGPDAQRAAIQAWADREGIRVVEWFTEPGVSGATPIVERTELNRAIATLARVKGGVLAFAKRDRLARDTGLAKAIEAIVESVGARVRTADGTSDGTGSVGLLSKGFHDLFGEYERAVIRERTTTALQIMKARGDCVGSVPYGYEAEIVNRKKTKLHAVPAEQDAIRQIFELHAEGFSTHRIAKELVSRKVPTRTGRPWFAMQVYRILSRAKAAEPIVGMKEFRLRTTPYELEIEVGLDDILEPFHVGEWNLCRHSLQSLEASIDSGMVRLEPVSILHGIDRAGLQRLRDPSFVAQHGQGTLPHQWLCALARLYIEGTGKRAKYPGDARCSYAGGWADLAAEDNSIFVECGTLQPNKVPEAMRAGQTVMVIPYASHECLSPDHRRHLDIGFARFAEENGPGEVHLGFVFKPTETRAR